MIVPQHIWAYIQRIENELQRRYEKTKKAEIKKALKDLKKRNIKFDIVFIDPPYKDDIAVKATELIISLNLLNHDGIIIIETDEKDRELKNLERLEVEVYDLRKYGRVNLIFLNQKENRKE